MEVNKMRHTRALYGEAEVRKMAESFDANDLLKRNAYQNKPLAFDQAYLAGIFVLYPYRMDLEGVFSQDKALAEKQGIALLCALHNQATYLKAGAAEQIAGICAAIFDYDIARSEQGFLTANVQFAMDNCGMGGDLYRTPNVSTIAALVAAADGIPMCKHGSPGNTDATGSSDFLKYCGVNLFAPKGAIAAALEKIGFGYTDALDTRYKSVHVQTHGSAHLAHMNDIIGPVTNPFDPRLMTMRVLGANHLIPPEVVANAYNLLNQYNVTNLRHGLFVRGFVAEARNGGIDEVSVFPGGTHVAELDDGQIKSYDLYPADFGIRAAEYFEVPSGTQGKAKFSQDILNGTIDGPPRQLVAANAAVLEYLARGMPFDQGFKAAEELIESHRPASLLQEYALMSRVI